MRQVFSRLRPALAPVTFDALRGPNLAAAVDCSLPDTKRIADDPTLGRLERNRHITAGYGQLATRLQALVDPEFARSRRSNVFPVWYAFGAYASRQAGHLLLDAELASSFLEARGARRSAELLLRFHPELTSPERAGLAAQVLGTLAELPERPRWLRRAGELLVTARFAPAAFSAINLSALIDPRTLVIVVSRLSRVVESTPDPARRVVHTLSQGLEEANREIFREVGGFGERFFRLRAEAGAALSTEAIFAACAQAGDGDLARAEALAAGSRASRADGLGHRLGDDHGTNFPGCRADDLLTAAFALYERAGRTGARASKQALVARANELAGYAEQRFFAQPAFAPGRVLEGEVDREALFGALTPLIQLGLPGAPWRFARFARDVLPARDATLLSPRVTEYNWARFEDRWPAIRKFYEAGYAQPQALWPMPEGDPLVRRERRFGSGPGGVAG